MITRKIKKIIYISLTVFLGFLLSIIFHSFLEIYLLNNNYNLKASKLFGHQCYLPDYLNISLTLLSLIGGLFLGFYWWNKVYKQ